MHCDGGGLWLQVSPTGTKSWVFRYDLNGRRRSMGLGSLITVNLGEARQAALACRKLLLDGIDPIAERDKRKASMQELKRPTFEQCMRDCIHGKRDEWRNAKHAQQWENTLKTYALPFIGSMPVDAVDTAAVIRCLDPIWKTKTETATRVRQRIEAILDWARVRGYRTGDNPAAWRGHLAEVLPKPRKVTKVRNHPSLEYERIPAFMAALCTRDSVSGMALEFTILTAARTGEVIGARWAEIDRKAKTWTIPADRMKAGREHTVPLCDRALELLDAMQPLSVDKLGKVPGFAFVFPGAKVGKGLSNMAMSNLLDGMAWMDKAGQTVTVHGFRSTFRVWAGERTNYPREVAEHALAHSLPDKVEAAYQRGTLFEKRRQLMIEWARFCASPAVEAAAVIPLNAGAAA